MLTEREDIKRAEALLTGAILDFYRVLVEQLYYDEAWELVTLEEIAETAGVSVQDARRYIRALSNLGLAEIRVSTTEYVRAANREQDLRAVPTT